MARRPDTETDKLIYLFTTAGKPTYRRGILDLLSYPTGHIQQFSYRVSDIHPAAYERLTSTKQEDAVVVFVDMDAQDVATYVPIRWVKILETVAPSSDDPEEKAKLCLQLESYIGYQTAADLKAWHYNLSVWLDSVRNEKKRGERYFVVAGHNVFESPPGSGQPSWENLVNLVSKSSRLGDAIFLRFDHLTSYGQPRAKVQLKPYRDGPRTYMLRPGQNYRLDFDVFVKQIGGSSQTGAPNVSLISSSELVVTTKPFQSIVSGLVQQFAVLSCKRTVERIKAALSVEIAEPKPPMVNTPNPVLLLEVSVSTKTLCWFLVLVFFGGLLVAFDKDALAGFLGLVGGSSQSFAASWLSLSLLFVKCAGSVLLACAAYLAFRKLPSG